MTLSKWLYFLSVSCATLREMVGSKVTYDLDDSCIQCPRQKRKNKRERKQQNRKLKIEEKRKVVDQ